MNSNRKSFKNHWAIWQDFNAFGMEFTGRPAVCLILLVKVFGWHNRIRFRASRACWQTQTIKAVKYGLCRRSNKNQWLSATGKMAIEYGNTGQRLTCALEVLKAVIYLGRYDSVITPISQLNSLVIRGSVRVQEGRKVFELRLMQLLPAGLHHYLARDWPPHNEPI